MNKYRTTSDSEPQSVQTNTQLVPGDIKKGKEKTIQGVASNQEVEEDVIRINPDINSMGSRG